MQKDALASWSADRQFVAHITEAAQATGASIEWLSDYWIAQLTKNGVRKHIIGYIFPLNDAAAAHLAKDKPATSAVLRHDSIQAVPHYLVRLYPGWSTDDLADQVIKKGGEFPLVIKPATESGGRDVHKVSTRKELHVVLTDMRMRYRAAAVSPLLAIRNEYRVVILDQKPLLVYEKVRSTANTDEWRHNLQHGAVPALVDSSKRIAQLHEIACTTTRSLGLRFAAVDIIDDGSLKVLEVNSGVTLERLSSYDAVFAQNVAAIYRKAVAACFTPQSKELA